MATTLSNFFRYYYFFATLYFVAAKPLSSFSFKRFDQNPSFDSEITLYGDAKIVNGGSSVQITNHTVLSSGRLIYKKPKVVNGGGSSVQITNASVLSSGRLIYKNPIRFLQRQAKSTKPLSFSTYFSFSISPENGDGLAFMFLPSGFPLKRFDGHSFGLSPGLKEEFLAVEFDTSMNVEDGDPNGNHVGIDVGGSLVSARVGNVSSIDLVLNSGERLHSWIDYDASSKRLEVRLSKWSKSRPDDPLVSYKIDLSKMWKEGEEVFVGIGSSNGNSTQTSSVYSWSFRLRSVPTWLHSEPLDPRVYSQDNTIKTPTTTQGRSTVCVIRVLTVLIFGIGCGALAASIVLFMWSIFVNKRNTIVVPAEYPVHSVEFGYEKIKIVAEKTMNDGKK